MPLQCEVVVDTGVTCDAQPWLADLLEHAADSEPALAGGRWQMTLRLSDDTTIAELHGQFFGDPTPTDVITFPTGDEADDDVTHLGDVVVSVATAASQSVEAGHSGAREVAFLALHGLLHLCGYDDATDDERSAMHERQYAYLAKWECERGRPW